MGKPTYLDLITRYGIDGAHPGGLALTMEVLKRESITKNTSVLDVGCGTGQTSAYIAKKYSCNVTAVDINKDMLKIAAQKIGRQSLHVRLVHADAMQLPFQHNSFDIVMVESVTVFTTIHKSLKEYARVLKNKGVLIDIELTAESPLTSKESSDIGSVFGIEQIPTRDEWCKMFRDAGFSNIQVFKVMMHSYGFFSPGLIRDFFPYFRVINLYRTKLGCRVYRCTA